jgi:hypothetical protein
MSAERVSTNKKDFPPLLGALFLGAVVIWVFTPHPITTVPLYFRYLEFVAETQPNFVTGVALVTALNLFVLASLGARFLGKNKQGAKLEALAGEDGPLSRADFLPGLVAIGAGLLVYGLSSLVWLPDEIRTLPIADGPLRETIERAIKLNFAFAAAGLSFVVWKWSIWGWLAKLVIPRGLPPFPSVKNALVIGSIDEDEPGKRPGWAIMGPKALVGNILITGSIGSGKTSGTIFPYLDQMLSNFSPRPALLGVDPKGKITSEALKIIERLGLQEHVLHMKLDGDVTFNPVYQRNALKNAGFSDIGKMIRSAAVNFMGKSFDSPFWEQSAATLVKNCLIYCAATKGYYTLTDLYTTMVRAVSDDVDFIKDLEACLKQENFDFEEKANIQFALQYFKFEYSQLDQKVRTGILATSTTFLNQFQEFQASQIFCPPEESLVIRSMDDVLDEGKLVLFDITNDGLARSMGTFIKLHYEKAVLKRLKQKRSTERPALLIVDEYQDVVTTGYGTDFGDETFLAEGREANAISIMATQSLSSLENSIGRDKPTQVLWNGFRTKILGHSNDLATIKSFQEIAGQEEKKRVSRSVSEHAPDAIPNLLLGGYESNQANISESVSTSQQKEYIVTAKDFARLELYEAYAMIFDGVGTTFKKLFLKPSYLKKKNTLHSKILAGLRPTFTAASVVLAATGGIGSTEVAHAFPSVCSVMNTSEFRSCLDFKVDMCMCGWPIPRPCAQFSYYVPQTFVEVMPDPKESFMGGLPGAAIQLATLSPSIPYGAEADEDTQSFHSHVATVPFVSIPFQLLPCGGASLDQFCFQGMSEHLGSNWTTGSADLLQPNFLAWSLSPKGCMVKGALASAGGESGEYSPSFPSCSYPMSWLPKYPPSNHSACTGWGVFYPRSGVYNGPSQTTGALMVAARMKSLSQEVFRATPGSFDEQWQMLYPQSSSCFREGQNVSILDTYKNVREIGRLTSGKVKGHLFTVWSKVSCCRDLAEVPAAYIAIEAMKLACAGLGG